MSQLNLQLPLYSLIAAYLIADSQMDSEEDDIKKLRDTLLAQSRYHEPWTTGTVNLTGLETSLFFKCKDGSARHIDLTSITDGDVESLINACDPAPFGRGTESVLDDAYRKALKLDDGAFVWRFNPDSGQFASQLARCFCPWQSDYWESIDKAIRAEPHKLNVYSKGGFFKAHQDTPRAENMFGSIVFVLPIHHQGGNLVLRHRIREFNFDASSIIQSSSSPTGSVAWIAFYSDVEHEVLEVTEGARVTITFNLYFDLSRAVPIQLKHPMKIPENPFSMVLRKLFQDAAFVSKHKYLGFGLEYKYPRELYGEESDEESDIVGYLKGPDAYLYQILQQVGLNPSLRYLYHTGDQADQKWCQFWVMPSWLIEGCSGEDGNGYYELEHIMDSDKNAKIIWRPGESEETVPKDDDHYWIKSYFHKENIDNYRARTIQIDWVTPATTNLAGYTYFREWGNEPVQDYFYYSVCIIVDVTKVTSLHAHPPSS